MLHGPVNRVQLTVTCLLSSTSFGELFNIQWSDCRIVWLGISDISRSLCYFLKIDIKWNNSFNIRIFSKLRTLVIYLALSIIIDGCKLISSIILFPEVFTDASKSIRCLQYTIQGIFRGLPSRTVMLLSTLTKCGR